MAGNKSERRDCGKIGRNQTFHSSTLPKKWNDARRRRMLEGMYKA
jgi:hypothetical protein